ncbi:DUF4402 domain-containing protein [Balneolales bacterium ANBcel1]|nr:DUF4402 domain-containing protein [Balneolales bacterium ANBcel1]
MKYTSIITLVFFLVISASTVAAQSTEVSDDIVVRAGINAALTLTGERALDFGSDITDGDSDAVLTPDNSGGIDSEINTGTGAETGQFDLSGVDEATVVLTFGDVTLEGNATNQTINFVPMIVQNGGGAILTTETADLDAGGDATFWVGGTLEMEDEDIDPDFFSGEFTLTIDYEL